MTKRPGRREQRRRVMFAKRKELLFAANSSLRRRHLDGSLVAGDPAQRDYIEALFRDIYDKDHRHV